MNERILQKAALFDIPGQAVIATDQDGTIVLWNDSAEDLYGWRSDEVMGRDIVEVTPTSLTREEAVGIMERLARGLAWSGDFMVQHKDGSTFRARVMDAPVRSESGELVGIIGISTRAGAANVLRAAAATDLHDTALD